jgi:DNA-binding NarL/FixJ family response regulator
VPRVFGQKQRIARPRRLADLDHDRRHLRTPGDLPDDGVDGIAIVGEGAAGDQVMRLVDAPSPHVILMDIRMPKVDGIAATAMVRRRPNPPEVLVLTTFDTDDHVVRALRAGASGFLLKDTAPAKIVAAIHAVANGEPVISPQVMRRLMDRVAVETGQHQKAQNRLRALSNRETEVVRAVARGLSNAEIGAVLFMSVATVKAHISSILSKLDLDSRTQIALLAHDAGLE